MKDIRTSYCSPVLWKKAQTWRERSRTAPAKCTGRVFSVVMVSPLEAIREAEAA
jgi:hypothetical protein